MVVSVTINELLECAREKTSSIVQSLYLIEECENEIKWLDKCKDDSLDFEVTVPYDHTDGRKYPRIYHSIDRDSIIVMWKVKLEELHNEKNKLIEELININEEIEKL